MEKYLCWMTHEEPYVPYKIMVKRMVGSTSSSSNVHGVVDNYNNYYRSMIIDAVRMNQEYTCDEKPNTYTTRFFKLLKDSDAPL